jgi:uncharacterized membrane protein
MLAPRCRHLYRFAFLAATLSLPATGLADPFSFEYQELNYPGAQNTLAYGINDSGSITGYYFGNAGDTGFTYINGTWTPYNVASSYSTDLYGINNSATLAGGYNSQDMTVDQGFIIPSGSPPQNLAPSCSTQSEDYGINNPGDVVGSDISEACVATGYIPGYVFNAQTQSYISFDCPNANAYPRGINDNGEIVGWCETSSFIYTGFMTSLTCLTSPTCALTTIGPSPDYSNFAYVINNAGLVVGVTENPQGTFQGFLLDNGVYQLLDYPGAVNTYAAGINNEDQIVGWFETTPGGPYNAFLATPVPEPSAWTLMALILLLLSPKLWARSRIRP